MFALLMACALGQTGNEPVSRQRSELFDALQADLKAKGQADANRLEQTREQIGRLTPHELQTLVNLYHSLKQGAAPVQVRTEPVSDDDQSMQPPDQSWLEPNPDSHLPALAALADDSYAGGFGLGAPIYGGLPAASMVPGSYGSPQSPVSGGPGSPFFGGGPLPFAGPIGFGTFSATGPVVGYSNPFMPGSPPWPTPFGP